MRENCMAQKKTYANGTEHIPITKLRPFEKYPFKVLTDDKMVELADSIANVGLLMPITVRPHPEGGYEILSGHRRVCACEMLGIAKVPAKIVNLNDDMAAIFLVESNFQRREWLPSEKAYAYRLRMEAMKRQGLRTDLTSSQIGTKLRTDEQLAKEMKESRNQIHRYIRLTNLVDSLLDMVDTKRLPLNAAVELSYLGSKAQTDIFEIICRDEISVSLKQAVKLRSRSKDGKISVTEIEAVLQERTVSGGSITLKQSLIRKYFPKEYSKEQIENVVVFLLDQWLKVQKQRRMTKKGGIGA